MHDYLRKGIGFGKTTAIGGIVFLLPLVVVGTLVGKAVQILLPLAQEVGPWLPVQTPGGYAVAAGLAFGVIVAACFGAGLAARHSLGRKFSDAAEKNLTLLFPRYAIFKDQLSGTLGGEFVNGRIKPVLVRLRDWDRVGLEVERDDAGTVTVYFPSSPDPWTGIVALVAEANVRPLSAEFSDVLATFEKLGRDSLSVIARGTGEGTA